MNKVWSNRILTLAVILGVSFAAGLLIFAQLLKTTSAWAGGFIGIASVAVPMILGTAIWILFQKRYYWGEMFPPLLSGIVVFSAVLGAIAGASYILLMVGFLERIARIGF